MVETIVELFEEQVHRSSVRHALRRHHDGYWEEFTWQEWWDASERVAAGLISAGVEPGEKICLIASTRLEWVVVDMGIIMAGAVCVPLHPATTAEELSHVLSENEIRKVVVENPLQLAKIVEAGEDETPVERVIYFDDDVLVAASGRRGGDVVRLESLGVPKTLELESLDDTMSRGRVALAEEPRFVANRRREIDGQRVATILYTAGVSHQPRGVALTHANLAAQVDALSALQLFSSDDVQLLFLPLAHIFSRMLVLAAIGYGMTTVFARGRDHLVEDLAEVKPTLMASVPWMYESLQREIVDRIRRRRVRSKLLPVALEVGKAVRRRVQGDDRVGMVLGMEHKLFSRLLLEDVHQWLGGEMRFLICGGAPLAEETSEFFFAAGVLLLEGYGLTEASGAVAFNMPDDFRIGSVGKPLPGVDITIAEDGEILVRGDTVMHSYVEEEGEDVRGLDEEGWLHTGDLGRFDGDGFLYVTDRKADMIITSTGEHLAPGALEKELCGHLLVAQAVIVGEGRPYLGALLALDPQGVLEFVKRQGLDFELSVQQLTEHRQLRRELRNHVDELNRRRASYEHIRRFAVLPEFLSPQNRTLTPSGQLRKAEVLKRYSQQLEELFSLPRQVDGGRTVSVVGRKS